MVSARFAGGLGPVYQVGVVVRDLERGMAEYSRILRLSAGSAWIPTTSQIPRLGRGHRKSQRVRAWGPVHLEMIEPGTGQGNAREWLETRGEGIFHLSVAADAKDLIAPAAEVPFEVLSQRQPDGAPAIIHLDTVASLGYFTELAWCPLAERLDAWVRSAG